VIDVTAALYVISVAARLVELHPTTLRKYERVGFLEPSRTPGRTRLYSHADIRRLQQIKRLVDEREINLAGVQMALDLTNLLREITTQLDQAQDVETLRRRVHAPLREAFATLGALE
jgi:MerR family transcriptional regulator/heat shock protein HspR